MGYWKLLIAGSEERMSGMKGLEVGGHYLKILFGAGKGQMYLLCNGRDLFAWVAQGFSIEQ